MFAALYIGLVAVLAYQLRNRILLLDGFTGVFQYLLSLGLTLFLVTWLNFLLYFICGWGVVRLVAAWAAVLAAILCLWFVRTASPPAAPLATRAKVLLGVKWDFWCLFVFLFVLVRFYSGLDFDDNDWLWSTFNFDDTPYHLSVTNALLNAHRFPPMDLDAATYPLKYHFMADFWLAHLQRQGTRAVFTIFGMNFLSGLILVGALWGVFKKWLKLPSRWVMLACVMFLFLNTSLINVLHYFWFRPDYFRPESVFDGLLLFPYFNFESLLNNLFNPQRGLLFTFPVGLLVLNAVFGGTAGYAAEQGLDFRRTRTLQALVLVCLLPFSHIVTFVVLACCLAPQAWEHRRWLLQRYWVCLPALTLAGLQLFYLVAYGPAPHPEHSAWDASAALPLQEFKTVPAIFRRALFWFFIDGDFLFWGSLIAATAFLRPSQPSPDAAPGLPLRDFLRQWRWYFAVCGLSFLGINFYRYSFDWGDSNKFVLFLNFGLTMVIVLGAASLRGGLGRILSRILWLFFFVLCVVPPAYQLAASILAEPYGSVLLFHGNDRAAAEWLRESTQSSDIVLTGAYGSIHFVSSLAGRPVLAGLYGDSNPYRQDQHSEDIRRIYEEGDLQALRKLNPRYVCISRYERSFYKLNPCWQEFIRKPGVLLFQAGVVEDAYAAYILDARRLLEQESIIPADAARSGSQGVAAPVPSGVRSDVR
jgi:hypothetical protein